MTGWDTAKRRYQLVHQAAPDIAQSGQRGLTQWLPAIEAEYGNVDNFLRDIQRRYFTTVLAQLDSVIEASPADAQASIAAVFAEVASVHPDMWRVLRDHARHSALAEGSASLRRSVLAGTGVDPAALMPDLIWDDPNASIISVFSRQDPSLRLRHGDPAEQSLTQK